MLCPKYILTGVLLLILTSCHQANKSHEIPFDQEAQKRTTDFSKSVFSKNRIDSKEILDTLKTLSDTVFVDTAKYFRTPVATIYANNAARTYFQVFEHPKGVITAIAFYQNGHQINVAEYYDNGQVVCKFNVTDEGVRFGRFFCFYKDGAYRRMGYYENGREVSDSARTYDESELKENKQSVYGTWTNGFITLEIDTNEIIIQYHGQCYYFYPLNSISSTMVELVWDKNMDCKFDNKTDNDFGLENIPQIRKPFATYSLIDTILVADYYFPEWVQKYSEEVSDIVFTAKYFRKEN